MEQITISISEIFGWSIGISTLVAVAFGALWSIGFNRIKEGQKAEFQKQIENQKSEFTKELETLKAKNDKINYITKIQFDAEYKMYQDLSQKMFNAYINIGMMNIEEKDIETLNDNDRKEYFLEKKKAAFDAYYSFIKCFQTYYPFINKDICDAYNIFKNQILNIDKTVSTIDYVRRNKDSINDNINKITEQINIINDVLRNYLQSLKVYED